MFQRILSFLGLSWYVPSGASFGAAASRSGAATDEAPDIEGQAVVRFTPGQKAAAVSAETEESLDEQRDRLTRRELVWPGKTDQFFYQNEQPLAYRYALTLTDLDPAYYTLRPPVGGTYQPDGSVLLQPGEKTAFEVAFHEPLSHEKARPRSFSYVITSFDPRRANDPGVIDADMPMRWVPLPQPTDFKITTEPAQVLMRPWRRWGQFALHLTNRSEMPPSVHLKIERAETKQALAEEPQEVGAWSQTLEARRAGTWHCVLPVWPKRSSYLAVVSGTAKVTEKTEYPLVLPRPLYVQYIPWLKRGRDWAFLLLPLSFLIWLFWGIPWYQSSTVSVQLQFLGLERAGALPPGVQAKDIAVQLLPLDKSGQMQQGSALTGLADMQGQGIYLFHLPPRLLGFRWLWPGHTGWNGASLEEMPFLVKLKEQPGLAQYNLSSQEIKISAASDQRPPFGNYIPSPVEATFLPKRGVILNLNFDLGQATQARNVEVTAEVSGVSQEPPPVHVLIVGGRAKPAWFPLTDYVPDGQNTPIELKAKTDNGYIAYAEKDVSWGDQPIPVTLSGFTKETITSPNPSPGPTKPAPGPTKPTPGPAKPAPGPKKPTPSPTKPAPGPTKPTPGPAKPAPGPKKPTPGPHPSSPSAVDPAQVAKWCVILGVSQAKDALVSEAQTKDSLKLKVDPIASPQGDNAFDLVITANKDCYIQIYEFNQVRKEKTPILGPVDKDGNLEIPPIPPHVPTPYLLKAGERWSYGFTAGNSGEEDYVVLARTAALGAPGADLSELLGQIGNQGGVVPGWAIQGVAWPK